MSAHPAGPRHADYLAQGGVAGRPATPVELAELVPQIWPRNAIRGEDDVVKIAEVPLTELAAEYGTPLFVYDEDDFRSRCREMATAFGSADAVHYASKAFLSVQIAKWVAEEGLALDICSSGELDIAKAAEFPAHRITMHGNNKSVPELAAAVGYGVGHIVVDSLTEIERLDAVAAAAGVVQDVFIRVTVGVEAHTHEFIATAHEDQKFGFSLADGAALTAIDTVFAAEHIRLVGLHSHIGSQIFDVDGFELAARRVLGLLADVVSRYGVAKTSQITTIDLGGGLGISYVRTDDPPLVHDVAAKLRSIVDHEAALVGLPPLALVVEPGRAIAGPAGVTVYEVGTIKDVTVGSGNEGPIRRRYVSVDGGMSDNIRTALYQAEYEHTLVNRIGTGAAVLSRVVGKHCESGDVVIKDAWTPDDLRPGDLLAVAATGAYCYAMSSRYNVVPRPAVVAVRDGRSRLLLRRETPVDLLSLEV